MYHLAGPFLGVLRVFLHLRVSRGLLSNKKISHLRQQKVFSLVYCAKGIKKSRSNSKTMGFF